MWYYLLMLTIIVPTMSLIMMTRMFTGKTYAEKACEGFTNDYNNCVTYYTIQGWVNLIAVVVFNIYFTHILKMYRDMRRPRHYDLMKMGDDDDRIEE